VSGWLSGLRTYRAVVTATWRCRTWPLLDRKESRRCAISSSVSGKAPAGSGPRRARPSSITAGRAEQGGIHAQSWTGDRRRVGRAYDAALARLGSAIADQLDLLGRNLIDYVDAGDLSVGKSENVTERRFRRRASRTYDVAVGVGCDRGADREVASPRQCGRHKPGRP